MPRAARIVLPGFAHHVTQRGNNHQDVFLDDGDRWSYLKCLKSQCKKHNVDVLGYCLMTNHVHLVVRPWHEDSLAKALGNTHLVHTQRLNRRQKRSGHLWQSRFYSCAVDYDHVLAVLHYVERNPVRAGLVRYPWEFAWSSAVAHVGMPDIAGLIDIEAWDGEQMDWQNWKEMLMSPVGEADRLSMRRSTRSGRPLAADAVLGRLEQMLGRRLCPRPVGRPRQK